MMQRNLAAEAIQNAAQNSLEENRPGDLLLPMNPSNREKNCPRRLVLGWAVSVTFRVPVRTNFRFARQIAPCPVRRKWDRAGRFIGSSCLPLAVIAFLAGCSSPSMSQHRLVAKPNMTFSDSAVFSYNSPKLLPQLAPGFAGSGGAQNSGCTSCR